MEYYYLIMEILINVAIGELCDKITILQIKKEKINNEDKLKNITFELNQLEKELSKIISKPNSQFEKLFINLKKINETLWGIEDDIRILEKEKQFDEKFIELARLVYKTNDYRFETKNKINLMFNSQINEVKSYEEY